MIEFAMLKMLDTQDWAEVEFRRLRRLTTQRLQALAAGDDRAARALAAARADCLDGLDGDAEVWSSAA